MEQPFGYDMRGERIAYRAGNRIVIQDGANNVVLNAESERGEVMVTRDAVVWHDGLGNRLHIYTKSGTSSLDFDRSLGDPWWFTSTDHYIAWYTSLSNDVRVIHSPAGRELVVATDANNGGQVMGPYLAWTARQTIGKPLIGMATRLPPE